MLRRLDEVHRLEAQASTQGRRLSHAEQEYIAVGKAQADHATWPELGRAVLDPLPQQPL